MIFTKFVKDFVKHLIDICIANVIKYYIFW